MFNTKIFLTFPPGHKYGSDLGGITVCRRVASTMDDIPDGLSTINTDVRESGINRDFRESGVNTDFREADRTVRELELID